MRTAERKMELGLIAPRAASFEQAAAGVGKGFVTFLRRIANRIAANRLVEMDDHQLADIGLTRSDLRSALDTGIMEDPTTRLARIARMAAAKAL
ncbi:MULTISPECIES: DUF1127 domain-containing protein [Agrobacterium]|jgi:hypothetical protein|uniref:DUF1127 domain-containing protein n=1 Tax=Agrobacterium rosae TaxID=1972867 RepID=A0A1R3TML1_9HYPH|nr:MULTISPECIES: DUF1127 domain-containing protein [Agrobacterium]MBN7807390.1 DUF1127 domain-containing protein [Agrobacterium rosae]MDX8302929.1 DUF1127 domain-containing protein [Agrobacterium rosae]MDX8314308.1 DUF1127 domain-containing protein [Agrobacterium rosae]POO56573.1 DUF1127 domain-containing protein [Agrobacterium rosae]SCX04592.1 hypothetical protein DSM25558_0683 [Agrobacterium sp. DSM 25558]